MYTYIRRNNRQSEQNCCMSFLNEIISELFVYLIFFLLFLFLTSVVAIYFFTGFGVVFLLLPLVGIIYYFGWKKKAKPIDLKYIQSNCLAKANQTHIYFSDYEKAKDPDWEKFRMPLLMYSNHISQRYELELLDDVVFNLERVIRLGSFDVYQVPEEMLDDVRIARSEYLFQQIKLPESYIILLSPTVLTKTNIESAIQYIFQTIAKYEENFIEREDLYLVNFLQENIK